MRGVLYKERNNCDNCCVADKSTESRRSGKIVRQVGRPVGTAVKVLSREYNANKLNFFSNSTTLFFLVLVSVVC